MKNKKGFTLIELLAVIVVLAIVTVIATQSILPLMSNAGRDAFASEANMALQSAADAVSLVSLGSADSDHYTEIVDNSNNVTGYCFTLQNLKDLGFFDKDLGDASTPDYEGTVVVELGNTNSYTYKVEMHNEDYYVKTSGGDIIAENLTADEPNGVGRYGESVTLKTSCS